LLLPGAHAVGHTFVEVGWADSSLYAADPHPLAYFVAHTGEGEADPLALSGDRASAFNAASAMHKVIEITLRVAFGIITS
jgi:hypothetical protein